MFNKAFQQKLLKEYETGQSMRHELIAQSNASLREAKQAIFALHRGEMKAARTQLDSVRADFKKLQRGLLKKHPNLLYQGAYLAAIEEYLEAELFLQALTNGRLEPVKDLEIAPEQYLGALCDMTGELTRQAVLRATERDYKQVERYFSLTQEVVGSLIRFDLVGALRQKYDDAKRNLKRLEGILYDISLRS